MTYKYTVLLRISDESCFRSEASRQVCFRRTAVYRKNTLGYVGLWLQYYKWPLVTKLNAILEVWCPVCIIHPWSQHELLCAFCLQRNGCEAEPSTGARWTWAPSRARPSRRDSSGASTWPCTTQPTSSSTCPSHTARCLGSTVAGTYRLRTRR